MLVVLLTSSVLLAWPFVVASGERGATNALLTQGDSSFIRQIPLRVNDLVYNPTTHQLLGSMPSAAGLNGNSIVSVDPTTGIVDAPVFIGSEPTRLTLSDDGQTLYASLEGSASIRRFNAVTRTPGPEFTFGQDSFHSIYLATDIAVAPGNPDLVAVARSFRGISPPQAGVAVFDNGVQRPNTGPGHTQGSDYLAFSASASTLYGSGFNGALATMTINASGVTQTGAVSFSGSKIRFDNGRLYGSSGQVINPSTGTLLGTFTGVGGSVFTTDSSVGRAYFLTGSQSSSNYSVTLRAFDLNTFLPVGTLNIPGINGQLTSLVRWGTNGLAFSTQGGQLFIIQTTLIPSADPIPTPTPTPFPSPTSTPTPVPLFIRQVPLVNNDIAYSSTTGLFYASVPSSVGSNGNSIQPINPNTGAFGPSVFIGSEPTKLAMSDDNQTLYVGLEGAASVRKINIVSQASTPQFSLAFGNIISPLFPNDLSVMPGNPNAVAVSRANRFSSPDTDGVAIYDNGLPRPTIANINTFTVEFSNTPDKLYSAGFGSGVDRLSANSAGANFLSTVQMINGGTIRFDNGLVYASRGGVLDPVTGLMKGSFTGLETSGGDSIMTTDVPNGRAYFLTTDGSSTTAVLRAFDLNTFVPLGAISFPIPIGSPSAPVSTLVRWGTNGLAFRNGAYVVFIQTDLVSNGGVIPSPTPTPSPSPSPTPTPTVPTFVKQISLPANDLAYVSSSGHIYASVPSSAGPNGNSITRINPQTATVGESVFIGSEPNKVALSDDGSTLHVSLDGAAAIRRFDIPTQTAGLQFTWGTANNRPVDMTVVPGSPLSLATTGGGDGVKIYDSGVPRPNSGNGGAHGIGAIAFTSPSILYGYDNGSSGFQLVKFIVDANGVSGTTVASNLITGFGNKIKAVGGLLYSTGRVVDPEARTIKGTFSNLGPTFTIDTTLGRVFTVSTFNGAATVRAFDINTFLPIGSVTVQAVTGTPVRIVRWGVNGLAFNTTDSSNPTASRVYVLQSALVSDVAPIPTGIQLTADKHFVSESSSNLSVTVTRTGDISAATSIDYATSNGTATAGADYTSTSGTLAFAAGQLTRTISIPILDDQIYEGPAETLNLTLSNPSGASLETPSSTLITISDTESRPTIFSSTVNTTEGNSGTKIFSLPFTLTNASVEQISLNYTTEDASALSGNDYVAKSGVLTFAPGTTTASIDITVNSDTVIESDETFLIRLSNPVNAFNSSSQLVVTIANDDSTVQFGSASYSIAENGNSLNVTITRAGEVAGSTVQYSTTDLAGANNCDVTNGAASSRCDFITTLGTFTFATGETSKSISIPIVDDVYAEGSETFTIALTNPVGVTTPNPTATVTITDNDAKNGTPNPSDIGSQFVRQHYIDFLNREPDTGGLNFWTNEITSCGSDSQCVEVKRINVSAAFFLSIEFQETGYFVYRVSKSAFGNLPGMSIPVTFNNFLKDTQQIGQGVQVGIGNWQIQLENNKQAYTLATVQRSDFLALFPLTLTAQQFVNQMNTNAGGVLTPQQTGQLVNFLASAPASASRRTTVLRSIADNATLRAAEFNKAFVLMQYFGYLRRNPNDSPDSDFSGLNFWLTKLESFGGNFADAEMVKAFLLSGEYRHRFGP